MGWSGLAARWINSSSPSQSISIAKVPWLGTITKDCVVVVRILLILSLFMIILSLFLHILSLFQPKASMTAIHVGRHPDWFGSGGSLNGDFAQQDLFDLSK